VDQVEPCTCGGSFRKHAKISLPIAQV